MHRGRSRPSWAVLLAVTAAVAASACATGGGPDDRASRPAEPVALDSGGDAPQETNPRSEGAAWGEVAGVLTFRGNPTRTYYGQGPVPADPSEIWRFPETAMCSESSEGDETRTWCGTGWTGQPAVWERNGETWIAFGAYDRRVHVLDADTGRRRLPDFETGDIIKGSVTVDPDGYPLLYTGSRDGYYRVLALDRDEIVELYRLSARDVGPTMWNDDWDGSGLVVDDHLLIGGENSRFHVLALRRGYDEDGRVQVDPEVVFHTAGWDDELLAALGDRQVSIENSVTLVDDVVYFANSGGLVQGWDLAPLWEGREPRRVFRYWVGDDVDASVVAGDDGSLYVGVEWERHTARARDVGQILRLDPAVDDPLVWSIDVQDAAKAGIWGTPALHRDLVIVPTHGGGVLGIDRETGAVRWTLDLPGPTWQSPVVVDDVLVQGDCGGVLHGFDVRDTTVEPPERWSVEIGGCIESTPVVWKGTIYVGTRGGYFHALADPS